MLSLVKDYFRSKLTNQATTGIGCSLVLVIDGVRPSVRPFETQNILMTGCAKDSIFKLYR